ncbi:hypothetical protein BD413DRAFT_488708 [Trametes elegans]|nr:hypothetical protein BD413DRAFT_488708 [Trametes elegans]
MSDSSDSEDSTYQPSLSPPLASSSSGNAPPPPPPPPPCACAYLQALQGRIRAGAYATTGGDYLEAIFTHREAFFAFPPGHHGCAIVFSDIARDLEERTPPPAGWRADWEGDSEAAAAFRHEAWVIASAL